MESNAFGNCIAKALDSILFNTRFIPEKGNKELKRLMNYLKKIKFRIYEKFRKRIIFFHIFFSFFERSEIFRMLTKL